MLKKLVSKINPNYIVMAAIFLILIILRLIIEYFVPGATRYPVP